MFIYGGGVQKNMVFFHTRKIRLHYVKKGEKKPLIFLHGLYGNAENYDHFTSILAEHFTVYAFDLLYHGKSSRPKEGVEIEHFADMLSEFADMKGLKSPAIMGHSAGALFAMDFASRYDTEHLYLIQPAGLPYFSSRLGLFSRMMYRGLRNYSSRPMLLFNKTLHGSVESIRNGLNPGYRKLLKENFKRDLTTTMRKINCPTTILWGKEDILFEIQNAKIFKEHIPQTTLIPLDGNHDWPILDPELLRNFFKN